MDALVIRVWFSPLAIILFTICVEALILPLWFGVGRTFLAEQEVRSSALLYLTSAISLQFVAIDGQNNVIIALLLVLALLLACRQQAFASGVVGGLAVAAVKFLPLLYLPAFFLVLPRRWRWLAGASTVIAIVYGACLVAHLPILLPLLTEGRARGAGSIPFLFEGITGLTLPSFVWDALVLLVCFSILLLIARSSRCASFSLRLRIITFGLAALTLALVILSKKSWPPYVMMSLFPICLLVRSTSKLYTTAFALFGVAALLSTSYYSTILGQFSATEFHRGLLARQTRCFILLALESSLVLSYMWLLRLSLLRIREAELPAELG
jgi:hypothetical protein